MEKSVTERNENLFNHVRSVAQRVPYCWWLILKRICDSNEYPGDQVVKSSLLSNFTRSDDSTFEDPKAVSGMIKLWPMAYPESAMTIAQTFEDMLSGYTSREQGLEGISLEGILIGLIDIAMLPGVTEEYEKFLFERLGDSRSCFARSMLATPTTDAGAGLLNNVIVKFVERACDNCSDNDTARRNRIIELLKLLEPVPLNTAYEASDRWNNLLTKLCRELAVRLFIESSFRQQIRWIVQ